MTSSGRTRQAWASAKSQWTASPYFFPADSPPIKHLEGDVRVSVEHVDVPLPDRTGRAEQRRTDFLHGFFTIIASRISSRAFSAWSDETKTLIEERIVTIP